MKRPQQPRITSVLMCGLCLAVTTHAAASTLAVAQQAAVTQLSLAPTLSVAATPATFVLGQVLSFAGTAQQLQPGSSARISAVSSPCFLDRPGGAALPSATVNSSGEARFEMKAWFRETASTPSSCKVAFTLSGANRAGSPFDATFNIDFKPVAPVPYAVTNTETLRNRLNFASISESGACRGESDPGDHPVGLRMVGGDIQFNIRSGPAGTKCKWKASAFALPNGMRLQSASVIQDREGFGDRCEAPGAPIGPGAWALVSQANPAVGVGNTTAGTNPNGAGAPIGVFGGTTVLLQCGTTAVNDNRITLKLDSFTFVGPPGLSFP